MQGVHLGSATATMERSAYYHQVTFLLCLYSLSHSHTTLYITLGSINISRLTAYLDTFHWTPSHVCLLATQEAHREPSPSLHPAEFTRSEQARQTCES